MIDVSKTGGLLHHDDAMLVFWAAWALAHQRVRQTQRVIHLNIDQWRLLINLACSKQ